MNYPHQRSSYLMPITHLGRNTSNGILRRDQQIPKSFREVGSSVFIHKTKQVDLHLPRVWHLLVSLPWRKRGSQLTGESLSSNIPKTYSTTTSSSNLIISVTFFAIHGLKTPMLTFLRSTCLVSQEIKAGERRRTFVSKHFGNFVDLIERASLSLNRCVVSSILADCC